MFPLLAAAVLEKLKGSRVQVKNRNVKYFLTGTLGP
jgi:hypothetical protein